MCCCCSPCTVAFANHWGTYCCMKTTKPFFCSLLQLFFIRNLFWYKLSHAYDVNPILACVSVSTKAGIAVTVTRSCVGVWDFMTGKLKYTLANSALGEPWFHSRQYKLFHKVWYKIQYTKGYPFSNSWKCFCGLPPHPPSVIETWDWLFKSATLSAIQ